MNDKIKGIDLVLPQEVKYILLKFEESNFECFLVGGCIRDFLLNRTINDYDFATNANPDEIKELFNDYHIISDFKSFGSIKVVINAKPYDITTYRTNEKYNDKHQPVSLSFSKTIDVDLQRRDFTVNAMAYNLKEFVDNFNGLDDLNNRLIRTVNNSNERFREDPLRILRAIRFASTLDFDIEQETSDSIIELAHLLENQSRERVNHEFTGILNGIGVKRVLMHYYQVLFFVSNNIKDVSIKENIDKLETSMSFERKILELYQGLQLPRLKSELMDLKYPSKLVKNIGLLYNYKEIAVDSVKDLQLILTNVEYSLLRLLYYGKELKRIDALYDTIISNELVFSVKQLKVSGSDLENWGIKPTLRGIILNEVLIKVINKELVNDRISLKQYIFNVYTSE